MKWFHHECAARHDPRLQTLGATCGAEGLGVYWGLLEEIGQHSDTFHLKVTGVSEKADQDFADFLRNPERTSDMVLPDYIAAHRIPRLPLRILAKNLFVTGKKLLAIVKACVDIDLFDSLKWAKYNILYSPAFERRADDYTRRQQRQPQIVRPKSEQGSKNHRTLSEGSTELLRSITEKVPPEQTAEGDTAETENRVSKDSFANDAIVISKDSQATNLEQLRNESYLIELSPEGFQQYCQQCRSLIRDWNVGRRNRFDWNPTEGELRKLFCGGNHSHKVALCYEAYNLLGEKINYPELVLRAVRLMLKSSQKKRILNPFGWLWSCLHGNGDGTTPWVQLITAEEEKVGSSTRRRAQADSDFEPP
jgi:hypothetical protein